MPMCRLSVEREKIEKKDSFKYQGIWITSDGRSEIDIKYRIGLAKKVFMDMKNVFCVRKIGIGLRKILLKCYICLVLTYGSEIWMISKIMEKKLEAVEM